MELKKEWKRKGKEEEEERNELWEESEERKAEIDGKHDRRDE